MIYVCQNDVKKMVVQQARVSLLEEVDSSARVRKIGGVYLAGAHSGFAAMEDDGRVD